MFYERSTWHQVGTLVDLVWQKYSPANVQLVKVPKPGPAEGEEKSDDIPDIPLPQTLVRIPVESHSEIVQSQNGTGKNSEG